MDLRQRISLTFSLSSDSSDLDHLAYRSNDPSTCLENDFRFAGLDNSIPVAIVRALGSQDVEISSHWIDEQHSEPRSQHGIQDAENVYLRPENSTNWINFVPFLISYKISKP